jgi:hypothetical protein
MILLLRRGGEVKDSTQDQKSGDDFVISNLDENCIPHGMVLQRRNPQKSDKRKKILERVV